MSAALHETLEARVGTVELWTRDHLGRFAVATLQLHCRRCHWDSYGGSWWQSLERAAAHECEQES